MPLPELLQTIPEEDEDVGCEIEQNEQVVETQDSRQTELNSVGKNAVPTLFKRPFSSPSVIAEKEEPSCTRSMCMKPLAHGSDLSLCFQKKVSSQSTTVGYESQQSFTRNQLSTKFTGATDNSKPSGTSCTGRFEKPSHSRSVSANWSVYDSISRSFALDRELNASGSLDTSEPPRRHILTLIDELAESRNEASRLSKIVTSAQMKYSSVIDNLKDMNQKLKRVEKDLTDSYIVVREIHRATQQYMGDSANTRMETVEEEVEVKEAVRPNLPRVGARGQALGREIEHHVHLKIEKERLKQQIRDIFDQLLDGNVDKTNM